MHLDSLSNLPGKQLLDSQDIKQAIVDGRLKGCVNKRSMMDGLFPNPRVCVHIDTSQLSMQVQEKLKVGWHYVSYCRSASQK